MYSFKKSGLYIISAIAIILIIALISVIYFSIPPRDFPNGAIFSIKKDMTIGETAVQLEKLSIIRSKFIYKVYAIMLNGESGVQAGDYLFDTPQSTLKIADRTVHGIQGLEKIKILIPEGSDSRAIVKILSKNIAGFDSVKFLALAKQNEGYLFPDTYFFNPNVTPDEVIIEMRTTFYRKLSTLEEKISASKKSLSDILKMASIVEKEANNNADRKLIAGVLWKRIEAGMPLQVDPPFFYFLNKTSSQLTLADLKVKSPYNLYQNMGLPPTPICNPGLNAIIATIEPIASKYWYYLSDSDGVMHYATTHDGHLANKEKYIR